MHVGIQDIDYFIRDFDKEGGMKFYFAIIQSKHPVADKRFKSSFRSSSSVGMANHLVSVTLGRLQFQKHAPSLHSGCLRSTPRRTKRAHL